MNKLRANFAASAVVCLLSLVASRPASAESISLAWDSSGILVAGYAVYVTPPSGTTTRVDVGGATVYTYSSALAGQRYCFAVAAYLLPLLEGPKSGQVCGYSNAPPTLTNPGNQTSTVGQPDTLQLQGLDPAGQPLTYTANGLPPGLSVMVSTGFISGTPTTAGTFSATATASDGTLTVSQSFTWTVSSSGTPSNTAPVVSAGTDKTVTLPASVTLTGTATDDGKPSPPATMTRSWTKVSGPGTVTFGSSTALSTTASFSTAGVYVLRLSVSDSALTSSDDVTVTASTTGGGGGSGSGLLGQYFVTKTFDSMAFSRTDATVNFDWGTGTPGGGVPVDNFSVRWTGEIAGPVTGAYTFTTLSDDGVRVWVNNQLVIDNWVPHALTTNTSSAITLQAGVRYPIKIDYYEQGNAATMRFQWSYPGQSIQTVPVAVLFPTGGAPPPPTGNVAPVVNAGANKTVTLPASVTLTGTATDDGKPNPPAAMTRSWTKVSGPGTVTFGSPTSLSTTASFSTAGTYVLRLSVSDSALTSSDDVTVTASTTAAGGGTAGLVGEYFATYTLSSLAVTRTDSRVSFSWNESPAWGVPADNFSVRWRGKVQAPVTGSYQFITESDNGVRMWVNGTQVINNWVSHSLTTNTGSSVTLQAGVRYDIVLEFFERTGNATMRLKWKYPGQITQTVPAEVLSH
jgi:hypothetical protein